MFCHEFILVDLRVFDNCVKACAGCDHVFNLAADMGGMGFIQSNHGVIFYNNTMISFNMLEAARKADIKRCAARRALPHARSATVCRCARAVALRCQPRATTAHLGAAAPCAAGLPPRAAPAPTWRRLRCRAPHARSMPLP
jgi:hypothetical protein